MSRPKNVLWICAISFSFDYLEWPHPGIPTLKTPEYPMPCKARVRFSNAMCSADLRTLAGVSFYTAARYMHFAWDRTGTAGPLWRVSAKPNTWATISGKSA